MAMFGGDSTKASNEDHPRGQKDHSDSVIDPALRSLASSPIPDKKRDNPLVNQHSSDHPSSMTLRVEPFQMSSPRRHHFDNSHRLPSPPPPITTMSADSHSPSPSVSVDRSSNSTPHIRRSPPHTNPMQPPSASAMYSSSYQHDPPIIQSARHHSNYSSRPESINHGAYIYPSHPNNFDHQSSRYDHPQQQQQQQQQQQHHHHHQAIHSQGRQYSSSSGVPVPFPVQHLTSAEHAAMAQQYERQTYNIPGQPPVTIQHTDDAATKLTDGIRRRCFNCCTTDTSTWRRSNLSPGKVLCNKCGLFERTHSRPRPDQFPHKRGPLAASTLRGRTPPGANQLPPISSGAPYQYQHQSLTPLNTGEYHTTNTTLPGLQAWHNNNSTSSSSGNSNSGGGGSNNSNHTIGPGGSSSNSNGAGGVGGSGGSGGGGSGGGGGDNNTNNNGSGSASGTPLLTNRRPTLDSPRLQHPQSHHSSPREQHQRVIYDEPLSSNAADGQRHPPSPPTSSSLSRSSTANASTGGGGGASTAQESVSAASSTSHTPPPAGSVREQAA